MKTIYDYVDEYGKYTFLEKEFNEVDNIIFATLSYNDFFNIVPGIGEGSITLKEATEEFLKRRNIKDAEKNIIAIREAAALLKKIYNTKRYKDLKLLNYEYQITFDIQFGALCIKLPDHTMYVSFEGTDNYLSGWEEDFYIAYKFPVPAQREAIRYLNRVVKFFGPRVYVGGHSKGGNLALVSSMYCRGSVFRKINWIYSNDGPGLRKKELESKRYDRVVQKFSHIVPNESFIGMLFYSYDDYVVIKSAKKKYIQHNCMNWEVDDNRFKRAELSEFSKKFHRAILNWLDKLDDDKKEEFVKVFFSIFKQVEITDLNEIRQAKITMMMKILKGMKNISKENRELLTSTLKDFYHEWKN